MSNSKKVPNFGESLIRSMPHVSLNITFVVFNVILIIQSAGRPEIPLREPLDNEFKLNRKMAK